MSLCNPSKFCISLEQARKVFLLTFSTQTVAASCFRPTTVCWAVTKMCGEEISFDWNNKKNGNLILIFINVCWLRKKLAILTIRGYLVIPLFKFELISKQTLPILKWVDIKHVPILSLASIIARRFNAILWNSFDQGYCADFTKFPL